MEVGARSGLNSRNTRRGAQHWATPEGFRLHLEAAQSALQSAGCALEVTSEVALTVDRGHSTAQGIAGRGPGTKRRVLGLEVHAQPARCWFPGVGRAGSSAGAAKSLVVVALPARGTTE